MYFSWQFGVISTKKLDWRNCKRLLRFTYHLYTSMYGSMSCYNCAQWLETQFVKVWWRYNVSNILKYLKISKKTQLYQIICHNLQSHLACSHIKLCVLIRHIICESLVKIQNFKNEWSLIMYENTQKNAIKSKSVPYLAVTSGMSIYQNVCIDWICILGKFGEDMWYQTQVLFIFVIFFRHRAVLQEKQYWKSKIRPCYDKLE